MKKILSLSLLCLFLVGCGMGARSYTNEAPVSVGANDWTKVKVIVLSQIKGDYEIVGEIWSDPVLHDMKWIKAEAAKLGANAISTPEMSSMGAKKNYAVKLK